MLGDSCPMRRRDLLTAVPLAAAATALASTAQASGGGEGAPAANTQYVDCSAVGLPIVLNNKVINYVFTVVRVNLSPRADSNKLREKEPFFRDALVRAAHRTPFTLATDYTKLDQAKLEAVFKPLATAIAGAGMVASIQVLTEAPKVRTGLPRPPGT